MIPPQVTGFFVVASTCTKPAEYRHKTLIQWFACGQASDCWVVFRLDQVTEFFIALIFFILGGNFLLVPQMSSHCV